MCVCVCVCEPLIMVLNATNFLHQITLNTKTERHCHFHGDVKALAIGDKNTLNNIDKFNIDKHQIKGNDHLMLKFRYIKVIEKQ